MLNLCLDLTHHPWTRGDDPAAVARTLALARAADAAGAAAIWVSEDPEGWDAFALLGALAHETTRARLGPSVTNPYVRQPNLLAAAVATLDRLSAGRAVLGLGRGQPEWYARALGVEVGSPLAALEGTIELLRQWWAPPHRASSDRHVRVRDWERTFHPLQSQPPVYLAAAGPKALALAGRRADGVIFNALTSDDFLADAIPRVRAEAAAAGRDPAALAFVLRTAVTLTDDPAPALERQKTSIALINTLPGMDRLLATAGFDVPAILAEVRRLMRTEETLAQGGGFPTLRRAGDLAAARAAIPTDLVARLALVGPLPHLRPRLRHLASLGVTHVSVAPPPPDHPPATLAATIQALRDDDA
jgi:5,10-methylenetetrahydromethanopterin reductase